MSSSPSSSSCETSTFENLDDSKEQPDRTKRRSPANVSYADATSTAQKTSLSSRKAAKRVCETSPALLVPALQASRATAPPPDYYLQARVAKYFDEVLYRGTLQTYNADTKYWEVQYDDGDSEEWSLDEIQAGLQLICEQQATTSTEQHLEAADSGPSTSTTTTNQQEQDCMFMHVRVAKWFFHEDTTPLYFGSIMEYLPAANLWVVEYDDGDAEDWDLAEVQLGLQLCRKYVKQCEFTLWDVYHVVTTVNASTKYNYNHDLLPSEFTRKPSVRRTVTKFYLFLLERQRCWIRRKTHGKRHPERWTNDRVLRHSFFCNNYRQLDRGTAYFHSQILDRWSRWSTSSSRRQSSTMTTRADWFQQVLWASYCYRLVNKVESFFRGNAAAADYNNANNKNSSPSIPTDKCFGRIPTIDEWPEFKKLALKTREKKLTFFTGAHQTCSFSNYILWMDTVHDNPERLQQVAHVNANDDAYKSTLESCFHAIHLQLPGCGTFLSWQIVCDLLESNCFSPKVRRDIDFCMLGKGAKGEFFPS
jgi:hypothetical protein